IPLVLWRDGRKIPLTLTPVEFSAQQMDALAWERLGLRLVPSRGTLAVAAVRPGSQAEGFGIDRGDLIVRLNNVSLDSVATFREALVSARNARSVLLVVRRGGRNYLVTFRL
ncbi:MAG: PDZ domain-containing protein, partial [Myxococcaceae bacterium]